MWKKSYSFVTKEVSKEQLWSLFADVNNWASWDEGIEFAKMDGPFEQGNHFTLRPKGGPTLKIELVEAQKHRRFVDLTRFPLARMYGEHQFEETADGLKVTTTMSVRGPLSFLWVKLVAQKIVAGLPNDMVQQVRAARAL
jgi:hypothetical protein